MLGALIADTAVKKKYRVLEPALKLHREIIKSSQDFGLLVAFPNKAGQAVIKMVGVIVYLLFGLAIFTSFNGNYNDLQMT